MDLKQALGATHAASAQRFSLYLPDSDRDGAAVSRIGDWIEAAMRLFADLNGGATRLPTAQGIWKPGSGEPVREATSVVYSFIRDPAHFEANLPRLAAFIHLRQARQSGRGDGRILRRGAGRLRLARLFHRPISASGAAALPVAGRVRALSS